MSSKSQKGTRIENPFMKNAQFSYGGEAGMASSLTQPTSALQTMSRTPLMQMTSNQHRNSSFQSKSNKSNQILSTPGPPPKASLSLGGMALPMEVS